MKENFEKFYQMLKNPNNDSLKLSMADTHHSKIFSLVIGGTEFGNLTRVFISDTKLKPFQVQIHTHRYPIELTVLKGNIKHILAYKTNEISSSTLQLSEFEYRSPLNGGKGLSYINEVNVRIEEHSLPIGSKVTLSEHDYHTMTCSKGSMWIVEEKGFKTESSRVLGVPFITDGLYNPPAMFQINDKCQIVTKAIKKIIDDYNNI